LLDDENSLLLKELPTFGDYIFAFDNWKDKKMIEKKMPLLRWRKDYQIKFYVYVSPDMGLAETVKRIIWLKEHKLLTYIMRDITCYNSKNSKFYMLLVEYCNFIPFYRKLNFYEYLTKTVKCVAEEVKKYGKMWDMAKRKKI